VERRLSDARITSGSTKNRTDNLQNQSAAIAPLCPPMQETAHERNPDSTKRNYQAILLPWWRETSVMICAGRFLTFPGCRALPSTGLGQSMLFVSCRISRRWISREAEPAKVKI